MFRSSYNNFKSFLGTCNASGIQLTHFAVFYSNKEKIIRICRQKLSSAVILTTLLWLYYLHHYLGPTDILDVKLIVNEEWINLELVRKWKGWNGKGVERLISTLRSATDG